MSDDWTGPVQLAAHANALAEAIGSGQAVPAAGSSAFPNCPATITGLT